MIKDCKKCGEPIGPGNCVRRVTGKYIYLSCKLCTNEYKREYDKRKKEEYAEKWLKRAGLS